MKNKKLSDTENLTSKASKSVTSNYFFRKRSRDRAFQNLIDVVPSNKNSIQKFEFDPNESDESLLLKTCNLIGNIEKIKFIQGFKNSSQAWSPLKKILRASNIRSRKIYLNIWLQIILVLDALLIILVQCLMIKEQLKIHLDKIN